MARLAMGPTWTTSSFQNGSTSHQSTAASNATAAASPPSPTLTNPDMILPHDGERESSTPSPPFDAVRRLHEDIHQSRFRTLSPDSPEYSHHSPQQFGRSGNYIANDYNASARDMSTNNNAIGVAFPMSHETQSNDYATHGVWFEQHEVAPPLSDIGEEEEEDDDRRYSRTSRISQDTVRGAHDDPPRSSSITPQHQWHSKDEADRSKNVDSYGALESPANTNGGASNSWNRDVESKGSSRNATPIAEPDNKGEHYGEENETEYDEGYAERRSFDSGEEQMLAIAEEEEGGSEEDIKEAERILANAKKRLTHMEGNLSRARSSMRATPSPAPSSYSPTPGYQSLTGFSKSLPKGERRSQTSLAGALLRQRAWQERNAHQSSHTRGVSDLHVSSFHSPRRSGDPRHQIRSASALASTDASGFEAPDASPRSRYFASRYNPDRNSGFLYNYAPPSPTRDDNNNTSQPNSPSVSYKSQQDGSGSANAEPKPKLESIEDFNAAYPSSPPSRTRSQMQMRDLQGQMFDLKSKISSLQKRAREDGQRRRSLQSLRTPSPFTAAEQWYTSALDYGAGGGLKRESLVITGTSDAQHGEKPSANYGDEHPSGAERNLAAIRGKEVGQLDVSGMSEKRLSRADTEDYFEDAVDYEDWPSDTEIDRSALEEILNEPLDSPGPLDQDLLQEFPNVPAMPEALRHEDRLDAFDYEHFYLHSVLGNYSGGDARRHSWSSDGSAETTRPGSQDGTDAETTGQGGNYHRRKNSADSVSTAATFATATEGEYSSEDEDYAGKEIDEALSLDRESATPTPTGNDKDLPLRQRYPNGNEATFESKQVQTEAHSTMGNGQYVDSPTYPGLSPGSELSTPRASHGRKRSSKDNRLPSHLASNAASSGERTDVVSTLISLASGNSASRLAMLSSSQLTGEDTALLEPLLQNLGQVCSDLLNPSSTGENNLARLRQRLSTANMALNGELDV